MQNVRSKAELDYIREYFHEKYENSGSTDSDLIFSPGPSAHCQVYNFTFFIGYSLLMLNLLFTVS